MNRKRLFGCLALAAMSMLLVPILLELGLRAGASLLPPKLRVAVENVISGAPSAEPWVLHPEHQWIVRPGIVNQVQKVTHRESYHLSTVELRKDSGIGFRNRPVDYAVDIAVVGDSFTFCFSERADCWARQLEAATGLGVVNLGIPGTGSRSHEIILRDYVSLWQPPLVIWQFFGNDFNDDFGLAFSRGEIDSSVVPTDQTPAIVNRFRRDHPILAGLRERSALFAAASALSVTDETSSGGSSDFLARYSQRLSSGEVLRFGQPYEPKAMDMTRRVNQAGLAISRDALLSARDLIESWGGRMAIVLVPTREEVYENLTASALGDDLRAIRSARLAMLDLCAELQLLCYDALADLQAAAAAGVLLYYEYDLHLNPLGNRVFAQRLEEWLVAENLLPAR